MYTNYSDAYENYLMHHGVKGMRWGIRRMLPRFSSGHSGSGGKKKKWSMVKKLGVAAVAGAGLYAANRATGGRYGRAAVSQFAHLSSQLTSGAKSAYSKARPGINNAMNVARSGASRAGSAIQRGAGAAANAGRSAANSAGFRAKYYAYNAENAARSAGGAIRRGAGVAANAARSGASRAGSAVRSNINYDRNFYGNAARTAGGTIQRGVGSAVGAARSGINYVANTAQNAYNQVRRKRR